MFEGAGCEVSLYYRQAPSSSSSPLASPRQQLEASHGPPEVMFLPCVLCWMSLPPAFFFVKNRLSFQDIYIERESTRSELYEGTSNNHSPVDSIVTLHRMEPDPVLSSVTAPVHSNCRLKLHWYYSRTIALNRKYFPINFFR
jgi:hypothetical protein